VRRIFIEGYRQEENAMPKSTNKSAPTQKEKNREVYSSIYETKDVLVAQVTSSVYGVLSLTEANLTKEARKKIHSQVNGDVTRQLDGLVTRLQKILD
tara:strand:+ start:109 stop:399 length:291 start_codon:yes stop_codon:yes gene_type:complete